MANKLLSYKDKKTKRLIQNKIRWTWLDIIDITNTRDKYNGVANLNIKSVLSIYLLAQIAAFQVAR